MSWWLVLVPIAALLVWFPFGSAAARADEQADKLLSKLTGGHF